MNPLERAVIEAARAYMNEPGIHEGTSGRAKLYRAVQALDAARNPEVQEIGWHELAEGDQLKSVKTGKFYPVRSVQKVKDGHRVTIVVAGVVTAVLRPSPAEPTAFVKRGASGQAVDTFVNVFSSGGGS